MTRHVALLRGINVGTAKAISMKDLAAVFESLGATSVTTLLRSGNVVFDGALSPAAIEAAVLAATDVSSRVLVFSAASFKRIVDANPLRAVSVDPSKAIVTFLEAMPASIDVPPDLAPELLAFGDDAMYQWLPDGVLASRLKPSFYKQFGLYTARNLRTVDKLVELLDA